MASLEAKNMRIIGHNRLGGYGGLGEGMSIQMTKDGRRIMWLAHEGPPKNFTGVDVSDPRDPKVVVQTDLAHNRMRSNSLDVVGDILAVGTNDLILIWGGGAVILAALLRIWRPLLAATVAPDVAAAEGLNPARQRLIFMLLLAGVIAIAMKIVGILLITALLIIPAAAARRMARTPEMMAVMAAVIGALAVAGGLGAAVAGDTPAGPTIVVAALALFLIGLIPWHGRTVNHG